MALGSDIVSQLLVMIKVEGGDSLAKAGAEMETLGKSVEGHSASMGRALNNAMLGVGALSAGVIAFSVDAAEKFQNQLVTAANNTAMGTAEMERMRSSVLSLGKQVPESLGDLVLGFEAAANAGFHNAAAYAVVSQAAKAATETGGNLKETVQTVTGVLKDFNLPAQDSGKALGILMTAAAEGDVRFPALAQNFNKVAVVAGAMHLPLSQAAAAYSDLTRFTHNAALSQTLMYGMLSHILTPTAASTKAIKELSQASGVDLVGAFDKVKSGGEDLTTFMGTMREAMQKAHLTSGQVVTTLNSLFGGVRGGLGALILMNQGWKDYNEIAKATAHNTGLVADQWKRTQEQLSFQAGILRNNIQELGISIGTTFLPPLVTITKEAIPAAQSLQDFAAAHPALISGALKAGLAIGGLGLAMKAGHAFVVPAVTGIGNLTLGLGRVAAGGAQSASILSLLAEDAGAVTAGVGGAVASTAGLAVLLAALPIGLSIANDHFKWFGDVVHNASGNVKDLSTTGTDAYGRLMQMQGAVASAAQQMHFLGKNAQEAATHGGELDTAQMHNMQTMQNYIGQLGEVKIGLKGFDEAQKSAFVEGTMQADQAAEQATQLVKQHYDAMKNGVLSDLAEQSSKAHAQWDLQRLNAIDSAEQQALKVVDASRRQKEGVVQAALEQKDPVIAANLQQRQQVIQSANEQADQVLAKASAQAERVIEQSKVQHNGVVAEADQQKADAISRAALQQAGVIERAKNQQLQHLATLRTERRQADTENLGMAQDALKHAHSMSTNLQQAWTQMATGNKNAIHTMRAGVKAEMDGMAGDSTAAATKMANQAIQQVQHEADVIVGHSIIPDMHHSVVNEMNQMASESEAAAARMASEVEAQMAALASQAESYGAQVGANFAAGLASEAGAVAAAAAADMAAAKAALEFHSPNKLGDDPELWGRNLGLGFARGLMSVIPQMAAAAAAALNTVKSTMSGTASFSLSPDQQLTANATGTGSQFSALIAAMDKLPKDFQAAGNAIIASYTAQLDKLQTKYVSDLETSRQKEIQKEQAARQAANEAERHFLQDHAIAITAANERHVQALEALESRKRQDEEAMLTAHNAKAAEAAAKRVEADNAAIAKLGETLGIKNAEQRQQLNEWLRHHNETLEQHIQKLRQAEQAHEQALTAAFNTHVDKIKAAMAQAASPAGLWDALKKQVDTLAKDSMKALDLAVLEGQKNLGGLTQAAVKAQEASQKLADAETEAAIRVAKAAHDYGAMFDAEQKKLQSTLDKAEKKYEYDYVHHTGNLEKDSAAIAAAQQALNAYSDATTAATAIANKNTTATGANAATIVLHTSRVSADTTAFGAHILALGQATIALQGFAGGLGKHLQQVAAVSTQAAQQTTAAADDAATVLQKQITQAQAALDLAKAQYALDVLHGGATQADTQAVQAAQAAVDRLTAAQNAATAAATANAAATNTATAAIQTFSQQQSEAQKAAAAALDLLAQKLYDQAHGISDTLPPLDQLKAQAQAAAEGAKQFADAAQQASAMITQAATTVAAGGSASSGSGIPSGVNTSVQTGAAAWYLPGFIQTLQTGIAAWEVKLAKDQAAGDLAAVAYDNSMISEFTGELNQAIAGYVQSKTSAPSTSPSAGSSSVSATNTTLNRIANNTQQIAQNTATLQQQLAEEKAQNAAWKKLFQLYDEQGLIRELGPGGGDAWLNTTLRSGLNG